MSFLNSILNPTILYAFAQKLCGTQVRNKMLTILKSIFGFYYWYYNNSYIIQCIGITVFQDLRLSCTVFL